MSPRNDALSPTRYARRGALIAALVLAACVTTTREGRIKQEIRASYDILERATAKLDVDTMINMRAKDLQVIGPKGEISNFDQMAEYSRRWFTMNKPPIVVHFTIKSIDVKSDDEACVESYQQASRYQDLLGKLRRNEHEVTQTECWVRTPAGWKMRRVENIHDQHRWIDGKQVDPSKPYDPDAPPFVPPKP
jgi:hypothetical protein